MLVNFIFLSENVKMR